MSRFEDTQEYIQSLKMRPACNRVLCSVFNIGENDIQRFNKKDKLFILDQEHCIDVRLRLKSGGHLLGQEKALSYEFYRFKTFTVEFWQNRMTEEPGEFFKIASQFYLHGYSDQSGVEFIEWKILNVMELMNWLKLCPIDKLKKKLRPAGGSRAAFLPIEYASIPHRVIFAEKEER